MFTTTKKSLATIAAVVAVCGPTSTAGAVPLGDVTAATGASQTAVLSPVPRVDGVGLTASRVEVDSPAGAPVSVDDGWSLTAPEAALGGALLIALLLFALLLHGTIPAGRLAVRHRV